MKKIRVLVVDDSSGMRKIAGSLRQAGILLTEVREAGNGSAAPAGQSAPDLGAMRLPVADGLDFLRSLAGVESSGGDPVVLITTAGGEALVIEALSGSRGDHRKALPPEQVLL